MIYLAIRVLNIFQILICDKLWSILKFVYFSNLKKEINYHKTLKPKIESNEGIQCFKTVLI